MWQELRYRTSQLVLAVNMAEYVDAARPFLNDFGLLYKGTELRSEGSRESKSRVEVES